MGLQWSESLSFCVDAELLSKGEIESVVVTYMLCDDVFFLCSLQLFWGRPLSSSSVVLSFLVSVLQPCLCNILERYNCN